MAPDRPSALELVRRRVDACEPGATTELRSIVTTFRSVARSSVAYSLFEGCGREIVGLAEALADRGDSGGARDILVAAARFVGNGGDGGSIERISRVLCGDADSVLAFVCAADDIAVDPRLFGMDSATLVNTLRSRTGDGTASAEDVCSCLKWVDGPARGAVLALGLEQFPSSSNLWAAAGDQRLAAGELAAAARAYECAVGTSDIEVSAQSPAPEDLFAHVDEVCRSLRDAEVDESEVGSGDALGVPRSGFAPLVNLAALCRDTHGAAAARAVVARYALRVRPCVAAMAYVQAGAGDDAIRLLAQTLRDSRDPGESEFLALEIGRVYAALGRTVDAVAALRSLWEMRGDVDGALQALFGDCGHGRRAQSQVSWAGMFTLRTGDEVRQAAVEALLREQEPTSCDREEAIRHLQLLDLGSLEQRAAALAALRKLGGRVGAVVYERLPDSNPRLRFRLTWLLEQWAWEAAEGRFRNTTGLQEPLPRGVGSIRPVENPPYGRAWIYVDHAIKHMLKLELDEAFRLVDYVCDEVAGPGKVTNPAMVARLVDLLIAEDERPRARRLLLSVVPHPRGD